MVKLVLMASLCTLLGGCGNSVECDSAEVRKVINEIVEENTDYTVTSYQGVSTTSSSSKKCSCIATLKITDKEYTSGLDLQEMPVEYDVILADNGEEFTVNLRYR